MTAPARPATGREWLGLAVLMLPTLLLALDMTVLHLAAPHLSADLKPTSSELLWILDIYGFMIAGFLVTMGTLGDRIGRRKLLLAGAVAFAAASVLAAFASSATQLIAARALLGVAGATLMPSTLSLLRSMFQVDHERTRAITIWITGFIVGSALGPMVGGALLEFFWWGSVFLIGVPVMVLLLVSAPFLLPESRDDSAAGGIDLSSALLSIVMVLAVIYGLKETARNGPHAVALLSVLFGLGTGALFVRRQRRLEHPMFDLGLFANRAFSTSVGAMMLTILALSGAWLMIFQYLQGVLGLSPWKAGLAMLPPALVQTVASLLIPALARRLRRSVLISGGLLLAVFGFAAIMAVDGIGDLALLVVGMTVMGMGVMPMMALGTDLVVSAAPQEKAGAAAATSETASELGMALGIAVIGSIGAAIYRHHMLEALPKDLPAPALLAAGDTLGGALGALAQLSASQGEQVMAAARQGFTLALHTNAAIGAVIVAVTALLTAVLLRDPAVRPDQHVTGNNSQ
ncbi:MFS transporter [Alcanivorax sp. N3-2A]|mgnify:CR=1 FL=1|nr:MFS transporter [Alcanivorax sp. N3-2A]|tara:strand:+ start:78638 stop:80188 length:1551 start_codon:yes stop_codon:yes gene_type:complete